jgi:hypothetical protein
MCWFLFLVSKFYPKKRIWVGVRGGRGKEVISQRGQNQEQIFHERDFFLAGTQVSLLEAKKR